MNYVFSPNKKLLIHPHICISTPSSTHPLPPPPPILPQAQSCRAELNALSPADDLMSLRATYMACVEEALQARGTAQASAHAIHVHVAQSLRDLLGGDGVG